MGYISPKAIEEFLNRPRPDFRKWQKYSDDKLWSIYDDLPITPPIFKKLKKHQRVCFLIGATQKRFTFWNDTGTGKSLLSIALIRYFYKLKTLDAAMVLVPQKTNRDSWALEIEKHSPNTPYRVLRGSSEEKLNAVLTDDTTQIWIDTYAGFARMLSDLKSPKNAKKQKWVLNATKIKKFAARVGGIFMDESIQVMLKGKHGSLQHRACRRVAKLCEVAFALNGTPFGRDPSDMWGQMYIVDRGETLGETLGLFRAAFFNEKQNFWGGSIYTFRKNMEPELNRILAAGSVRYEANKADLPTKVHVPRYINLSADAERLYDDAVNELQRSHGNFEAMQNSFIRMRQISSGWVGYKNDEEGTKAQYEFDENPKMDELLSLIEETHRGAKSIVFYEFTHSANMIARELKKMKIGFEFISGKTKNGQAILDAFDKNAKLRTVLLQNKMAIGLNLQAAQYGFFFESPVPAHLRKQAERRLVRQYSDHSTVFIYDLIARGTFDQRILDFHAEGASLFDAIVDGRERLKQCR